MKNQKLLAVFTTAILFTITFVVVQSCQKEIEQSPQRSESVFGNLKTGGGMTAEDSLFFEKINLFDSIMKNYESDSTYTLNEQYATDSAVWYLEAWFNARYAFTDENYTSTECKTDTITVSLNMNNLVEMDDIANAADLMYDKVSNLLDLSTLNNKELVVLDLMTIQTNSSEIEIRVKPVFGEKGTITFSGDPFGENDDWYFGQWLGDCDLSVFEDTDAAQKITEAVMANKKVPDVIHYYSDIEEVERQGYEYQDENDKYLIFYILKPLGNFTADDKCLISEEMNFHFHGEETVIYDKIQIELNKTFLTITMEGLQDGNHNNIPRIRHHNDLEYGIMHFGNPPYIDIIKEHLNE